MYFLCPVDEAHPVFLASVVARKFFSKCLNHNSTMSHGQLIFGFLFSLHTLLFLYTHTHTLLWN